MGAVRQRVWRLRQWPLLLVLAVAASEAQMAPACAKLATAQPDRAVAVAVPAAVPLLQRRSDLRSQALADYLLAASASADADAARMRLQDRARASTDPMLTVLALHMPCAGPSCRNIEASQWSRLEPENLLAWLALPTPTLGAADSGYLLHEIANHVRASRSYRQEVEALLRDLPPPGLGLRQPWGLLNLRALAVACRDPRDLPTAERCDAIAEALWADGGATERLVAVILGQHVLQQWPARRAVWAPRLRELEAVVRAGPPPGGVLATKQEVCQALLLSREGERAALSEVDRGRILATASGLSLWDLRVRTRRDLGRPPP